MSALETALTQVVGRPYADPGHPPHSYSCTQLAAFLRSALGLETPLCLPDKPWLDLSLDEQKAAVRRTRQVYPWKRVATPDVGDLILCAKRSGLPSYHCGIWVGSGVAHAYGALLSGSGSVVITARGPFESLYTHFEVWRLGGA